MFLYKVLKESRGLFFVFLAFVLFQIFFTILGIENFPFLNWGMYSAPANKAVNYEVLIISVNKEGFNYTKEPQMTVDMLITPIFKYEILRENGGTQEPFFLKRLSFMESVVPVRVSVYFKRKMNEVNDPLRKEKLERWAVRYIEEITGEEVQSLQVVKALFRYSDDNSLTFEGQETLIDI